MTVYLFPENQTKQSKREEKEKKKASVRNSKSRKRKDDENSEIRQREKKHTDGELGQIRFMKKSSMVTDDDW